MLHDDDRFMCNIISSHAGTRNVSPERSGRCTDWCDISCNRIRYRWLLIVELSSIVSSWEKYGPLITCKLNVNKKVIILHHDTLHRLCNKPIICNSGKSSGAAYTRQSNLPDQAGLVFLFSSGDSYSAKLHALTGSSLLWMRANTILNLRLYNASLNYDYDGTMDGRYDNKR